MLTNDIAEKLPFWDFDQEVMVYNDGSFGIGFKIIGADLTAYSNDEINNYIKNLEQIFISTNAGSRFQVVIRLGNDVDELLKKHKEVGIGSNDELADFRNNYLKDRADNQEFFQRELYFFYRGGPKKMNPLKFWEKRAMFLQRSIDKFEIDKLAFIKQANQIEQTLISSNLKAVKLSQNEWFQLGFSYFNPDRIAPNLRFTVFDDSLNSQMFLTDIAIQKSGINCGNRLIRPITLKSLPESETYSSMSQILLDVPFPCWFIYSIEIPDQEKERSMLQFQRQVTSSFVNGESKVRDLESESKLSHLNELMSELIEGSEKIVNMSLAAIIDGAHEQELDERCHYFLRTLREMGGCEGIEERLAALEVFTKNAPGSCEGIRHKKMKSSNASHLLSIFDYWRGNSRPICLLPNRSGVLVSLDPFDPELPNWNGLIFGGSGAGKSFTVSQLILQFSAQKPKPKVVWIDNGASSKGPIDTLGGSFIDLNLESSIKLNMFDILPEEIEPGPIKIKLILAVLESILKEEEQKGLPKREKALLEEVIIKTYYACKGKIPTLSDLKKNLEVHEDSILRRYSQILFSWTGKTPYGKILDGQTNIKLDHNFTGIEVKGLDANPDLQNILMLLITDFIRNEAQKDLSCPYLLIIDEAWKIFETPCGLSFALEAYRTFRKLNGGIWCISQNYKDFLKNEEIKNVIFPNTTSIFILKQQKIEWEHFQKALELNDNELEVVKSLEVIKGEYSEFYFIQQQNRSVLRLKPDPLSYWVCTSDPLDKAKISTYQKNNPELSRLATLKLIVNDQQRSPH